MSTLRLTYEDATVRRYDLIDEKGKKVGEAVQSVPTAEDITRANIEEALRSMLQVNKAFLALAAPTAAEQLKQLQRVSKQNIRLARMLLGAFDAEE